MAVKYNEKSCGIVLFRTERHKNLFLLLHYPGGHFDFPKGHMEKGETEHQTAIRELEEETGIKDVKFIEGFREPISYTYRRGKKLSNKLVVFFLAQTIAKDVSISHEHQDFIWLSYEEALEKVTFDNARNLLIKSNEFLLETGRLRPRTR